MSNQASITTEVALNHIGLWLNEWVEPRGGEVKIVENMAHLWEEVLEVQTDGSPRVLIVCTGEVSRGGFAQANTLHRVDRQFGVVVVRGHGFKNLVAEKKGDILPFVTVMDTLRDRLRVMISITEEFPIYYKGWKPLPNIAPTPSQNIFLNASIIEFSTAADIPGVTKTAPIQP